MCRGGSTKTARMEAWQSGIEARRAPRCCEVMPASRRALTEVKSRTERVKRPSCADTPALAKMRSVVSRRYGFHALLL